MCLYPKLIKNRKYTVTKKNGGNVPELNDMRAKYVPVGCGKCMECKRQKSREWQVRLAEEIKINKNGKFVTLTFSDEELQKLDDIIPEEYTGYERDNEICRLSVRRFLERWRKKYKKSIRHWLVSEIGGTRTERIHLHGILWTDEVEDIKEKWGYGFVYIGDYVGDITINYIVKYVNKVDEKHKEYNSKIYTSKGIGANYMLRNDVKRNEYRGDKTIETYKNRTGIELGLPIYYRNKIYNDQQREKLWLYKLDKEVRYVNGIEVDVSESDDEYYKLLYQERRKNRYLGYGDDRINWELKKYEAERRHIKKIERLKKIEEINNVYKNML